MLNVFIPLGLICCALLTVEVRSQEKLSEVPIGERHGNQWKIPLSASGTTRVPRVFASLRTANFTDALSTPLAVQPDIDFWELKYDRERKSEHAVLVFDSPPVLRQELKPVQPAGDGTLTLSCSLGQTKGQKLRFEPQPNKNTIGYWTIPNDYVFWSIKLDKPSSFNVGILQGCGPKGGGKAKIALCKDEQELESIEFEVLQTGHYQNFVWRHLGTMTTKEPGEFEIRVQALKINEVALMDVRQLHLSPKR